MNTYVRAYIHENLTRVHRADGIEISIHLESRRIAAVGFWEIRSNRQHYRGFHRFDQDAWLFLCNLLIGTTRLGKRYKTECADRERVAAINIYWRG